MLSLISIPPSMLEHGDIGWIITLVIGIGFLYLVIRIVKYIVDSLNANREQLGNVLKVYEKLQTSYDMIIPATIKSIEKIDINQSILSEKLQAFGSDYRELQSAYNIVIPGLIKAVEKIDKNQQELTIRLQQSDINIRDLKAASDTRYQYDMDTRHMFEKLEDKEKNEKKG